MSKLLDSILGGPSLLKGGGLFGDLLKGLFGGDEEEPVAPAPPPPVAPPVVPPTPVVAPPTVIPLPDDEAVQKAKKRSIASQLQRRGRQSTILSSDSTGDTLG